MKFDFNVVLVFLILALAIFVMHNETILRPDIPFECIEGFERLLSYSYTEYNGTSVESEKEEIVRYTLSIYPDIDVNDIKDIRLRKFYEMCLQYK